MYKLKLTAALILIFSPILAVGGLDADDLPGTSTWYFHADFAAMRSSEGGKRIWIWLDSEVFEDIRDDAGVDLAAEVDHITAYSTPESGAVVVLDGNISQETMDKAMVAAATAEKFDTLKYKGKTYYYVQGDGKIDDDISIDGFDNRAYFSFAVKNKLIAASRKTQIEELLDNGGRITGSKSHDGALFVLTAERSLIQAGIDAESFDDSGGFESNILRNTRQAALMIADVAGKIAIEAQLITTEPEMAESLASIARGLIALQAFSDDIEPAITEFLRGTKVSVKDNVLKVSITLTPEALVAALHEA